MHVESVRERSACHGKNQQPLTYFWSFEPDRANLNKDLYSVARLLTLLKEVAYYLVFIYLFIYLSEMLVPILILIAQHPNSTGTRLK